MLTHIKYMLVLILSSGTANLYAQEETQEKINKRIEDSLYILEVEEHLPVAKVLHAEPLFIDLIRDLGARKGEKEWNVGMGLIDNQSFDKYEALVEYEWAPVDRLGLEVELPFSFYYTGGTGNQIPTSKLNGLKLAAQYTFLVSERRNLSMAVGYIHEFEMVAFKDYGKTRLFNGNIYNPFFIIAKRWGNNWHTLLYAGPSIEQETSTGSWHGDWQINSNFHYMIPGTRNFIGVEFNKSLTPTGEFDMTIRPQMRIELTDKVLVGIVTGIPVNRENQRFSSFLRIIYEPSHRKDPVRH